jgi:hypothetical protein
MRALILIVIGTLLLLGGVFSLTSTINSGSVSFVEECTNKGGVPIRGYTKLLCVRQDALF